MNAVQTKRLLKLADFLQTLPRQKFDFAVVARERGKPMLEALKAGKTECGTVACALGWAPAVFPRHLKWERPYWSGETALEINFRNASSSYAQTFPVAERFFGLTEDEAQRLFEPSVSPLGYRATSKRVAKAIRQFVAQKRQAKPRSGNHEKAAVRQD